jgi:cytochrome P450
MGALFSVGLSKDAHAVESGHKLYKLPRPFTLPLFGSALQFDIRNPHTTLLKIAKNTGLVTFLSFGIFKHPMVHVANAEAAMNILRQDNSVFLKGHGYSVIRSVTPRHLLVMEGEEWSRVHKLAVSVFGSAHRHHGPALLTHAEKFVDTIANGHDNGRIFHVNDLGGAVRNWSLGLISDVVLGAPAAAAHYSCALSRQSGECMSIHRARDRANDHAASSPQAR